MKADIIVLASPMYYWGISGQLKCAFDRLFAEGDTEDNFAPVKAFYKGLIHNLGWNDLGIVYAGGNMDAGSILNKPEQLKAAEELGRSIS